MLQKSDIEKFHKDIDELRRRGIKKLNAEIEKRTGESKGNVSEYLNKKKDPSEAFLGKFYKSFADVLNNAPKSDSRAILGRDSEMASLAELTEITKNLSAARITAEQNQKELIAEVRAIRIAITGGFDPQTIRDVQAKVSGLLEFVLDGATDRKGFHSREEAFAAYCKKRDEFLPKIEQGGIRTGSGKQNKRKA